MYSVNDRIKKIRLDHGYTQKQFAEKLKISQAHLSKIERGYDNVSDSVIKLISITEHVPYDWIKTGKGNMYQQYNKKSSVYTAIDDLKGYIEGLHSYISPDDASHIKNCIIDFGGLLSHAYSLPPSLSTKYLSTLSNIIESLDFLASLGIDLDYSDKKEDYKNLIEKISLAYDRIKFLQEEISEYTNISINRNKETIFNF